MAKEKIQVEAKDAPKEEVKEVAKEVVSNAVESKEKTADVIAVESAEEKRTDKPREERAGIVYIYSSQNNTIVHITDLAGNTISRVSGGMVTKHSRLKADPTVAMFVVKKASERARDLGINAVYVRMRAKTGSEGIGSGAHAAVKSLDKEGFRVINVLDATRVPRGGPKKKGGKRGRRV